MRHIFGMLFLILILVQFPRSPERTPQSEPSRDGVYHLSQGSDGCSEKVTWITQCDGFTLNDELFCDINLGQKSAEQKHSSGKKTILVSNTRENNLVRRNTVTLFRKNKTSARLEAQDFIFLDTPNQLLWERSNNIHTNSSCLYIK